MRIFGAAVLVLSLCAVVCGGEVAATQPILSFPTFGVEFAQPAGSKVSPPNSAREICTFHFGVEEGKKAPGMIGVSILPSAGNDGKISAGVLNEIALSAHVTPAKKMMKMNGEDVPTYVGIPKAGESATEEILCILCHGSHAYLFSAMHEVDFPMEERLQAFLSTMKFLPLETPLGHLEEFCPGPTAVFSRASLNWPAITRFRLIDDNQVEVTIDNYIDMRHDFAINVMALRLPADDSMEMRREALASGLAAKMNLAHPWTWHAHPLLPALQISDEQHTVGKTMLFKYGNDIHDSPFLNVNLKNNGNFGLHYITRVL